MCRCCGHQVDPHLERPRAGPLAECEPGRLCQRPCVEVGLGVCRGGAGCVQRGAGCGVNPAPWPRSGDPGSASAQGLDRGQNPATLPLCGPSLPQVKTSQSHGQCSFWKVSSKAAQRARHKLVPAHWGPSPMSPPRRGGSGPSSTAAATTAPPGGGGQRRAQPATLSAPAALGLLVGSTRGRPAWSEGIHSPNVREDRTPAHHHPPPPLPPKVRNSAQRLTDGRPVLPRDGPATRVT